MAVPGRALFGLIVVWALALPCALRAQYDIDDIETIPVARKLAIDFRLYDDAIEMLESIKDKSKRDIAIASIYKIQGDHCAESDSTKATEYYSKALALIKDATDEAVRIEYVRMLIDVASSGTQSTDKSKKDLDDAKKIADEVWQSITTRTKPMDWAENADGTPSTLYMLLMNTYYERARACYRLALLEPEGSQKRNEWLKLTDEIIRKMMFDRIADGVEALFRVHLLAGDVALARPDPQLAVERYLELPEFMKAFSQAHPMVREMSLLGYINAVETLLNRMGDAPEAIHEALGIIEKALREFPIALKETRGKTLRMYGVSARIKIGEGRLADALKELFELAKDPDKEFQVKASLQLARIAKGSGLPNADRLRCARQALEVNTFDLVMEANQVIHAILANIGSPEDFEAYAPLCYVLLANSAENTRRYFDEAVICMEAADRLSFFRKKYTEGSAEKLPPHFFDGSGKAICSGASLSAPIDLKTHADAFELPREFARRAKAAAGWLLQSQFGGDKDNAKFKSFEQEIEVWFRKYEKEDDRYKAITSAGYDMFNKKDWVGAAQHLLSTLKGGSAMQANYFAGVAFANAYTGAGTVSAGPIDREKFWLDGYQLLDLPFEAQSARIDPEFPNVTPNLRDELRAALDAFMDPKRSVDRRLDTRGMAIFALKRTLLIKIDERANEITESGFDMASSNIAGALTAMSKLANAQFLNQPEDKRSADPTMLLLGRAVNQLAYCYRYPRLDTTGSAADAQIAEIKKQDLREALDYLLMSGDAFDPHFNAEIARGATPQAQANAMDVKRSTMKMKFDACVEAGIAKDAQRTFIDYRGLFEKAGDDAARQKTRKELAAMASKLGEALREAGGLYWSAQMYAGTKLDYLFADLSRGDPIDFFAAQAHNAVEGNIPFKDLNSGQNREAVGKYLYERLIKDIYGPDATVTMSDKRKAAIAPMLPEGEAVLFETFWKETRAKYEKLYAEGFVTVLQDPALVAGAGGALVKDLVSEALKIAKDETKGAQVALDLIDAERKKAQAANQKDKADAITFVLYRIDSDAAAYAWIDSPSFVGALLRYCTERKEAYRKAAATRLGGWLNVRKWTAELNDTPLYTEKDAKVYATLYNEVQEWRTAADAWGMYLETRERQYGDVSYIEVDDQRKKIGTSYSAEELEVRYNYAHAALEAARTATGAEREKLLDIALHQLRRCYSYCQIRNLLETRLKTTDWYKNFVDDTFKDGLCRMLDRYYVDILFDSAAVVEMYGDDGLIPQWKYQYYDQTRDKNTPQKKESVFQVLPTDKTSCYSEASIIYGMLHSGLITRGGGMYRDDYRRAFLSWADVRLKYAGAIEQSNAQEAIKVREYVEGRLEQEYDSLHMMFDQAGLDFMEQVKKRMTAVPEDKKAG